MERTRPSHPHGQLAWMGFAVCSQSSARFTCEGGREGSKNHGLNATCSHARCFLLVFLSIATEEYSTLNVCVRLILMIAPQIARPCPSYALALPRSPSSQPHPRSAIDLSPSFAAYRTGVPVSRKTCSRRLPQSISYCP